MDATKQYDDTYFENNDLIVHAENATREGLAHTEENDPRGAEQAGK